MPTLDSIALRDAKNSLGEARYWAERPINRLGLVADVLNRLDRDGWPNKSDVGWSEHDVEVYGNRWSYLRLTSVAEEHPPNKQLIRCRLRSGWSLPAKVIFWSLCGFEMLVLGFAGTWLRWWLWVLLLIPVPVSIWFLRREQRTLQSMIMLLLDNVAKEWRLVKVPDPVAVSPEDKPLDTSAVEKSPFRPAPDPGKSGALPKPTQQT
jgi:hypothetical protein